MINHSSNQSTAQTQKLLSVIEALKPASTTETGRSWLIKSLHPSDPIVECGGVPDETSSPTVMLNYQSTFTVVPPLALATPTWRFVGHLMPDPVAFGYISVQDGNGAQTGHYNWLNTQLTGGTYGDRFLSFCRQGVLRWRLAYASVSMYQDGPDLANQGTIAAAQYAVDYQKFSCPCAAAALPPPLLQSGSIPIREFSTFGTFPTFDNLQAMPNAYFGQSKYGCYMPLHLDQLQEWSGIRNTGLLGSGHLNGGATQYGAASYALPGPLAPPPVYPYPSATAAYVNPGGAVDGTIIPRPCNAKWGSFAVVNLAAATSFSCFVRMGFEAMVVPESPMASLQRISPKFDPEALESYARICREMKDAYPVEYNDLGKLWEVIKQAAKVALPVLQGLGGPVGGIAGGVSALMKVLTASPVPRAAPAAARSDVLPAAVTQEVRKAIAGPAAPAVAAAVKAAMGKGPAKGGRAVRRKAAQKARPSPQ